MTQTQNSARPQPDAGLPPEVRERIDVEARGAGLRQKPTVDAIRRRRAQISIVAVVVVVGLLLVTVFASGIGPDENIVLSPNVLRLGLLALAVGFTVYAIEKELHLRRLSRLLADELAINTALSHSLDQYSALVAAGQVVNSVLDLDEVLDVILENALDMLEGSRGSVMLLEGTDELRAVAVRGNDRAKGAAVKVGESVSGQVARTREALVLSGKVDQEQFPGHERDGTAPTTSVCAPLEHRGELLGVINVSRESNDDYDEYALQTLRLFAEPAAAAIANGRLYEAERAHVVELLELDRMKSEFMASMGHELRTPLTSIRGAVAASRRPVLGDEERAHLLDVVDRQAERLHGMVEEMLTSADQRTPGIMPLLRPVDLAALVRLVALDSQVAGRPVQVDGPRRCDVRGDPEALRRIVGNLIENAFKYGAEPVRILISADDSGALLSVEDQGPGVPASERDKIFERYYRANRSDSTPGHGLGLPIVRGLATACGGEVWVDDATNGGAAFRVSLPVRSETDDESSRTSRPSQEEAPWAASQRS